MLHLWPGDLPHVFEPKLLLCPYPLFRGVPRVREVGEELGPIDHMREVVEVVVLDLLAELALALHLDRDLEVELLVDDAFLAADDVQLFHCRTGRSAREFKAFLAVDEAAVDVFQDGREQLGRVALHIQVKEGVEVVKLEELEP